MSFRIDRTEIKNIETMPNGSLRLLATVARVGELKYLDARGPRTEYLDSAELFNQQWMDSLANAPLTLTHPPEPITPENWKNYAIGSVGGVPMPREDSGELDFVVIVNDADAIKAIQDGDCTQLSPGYKVEVEQRKDGKLYQKNRVANHLSLVQVARGGGSCKLHMDGVDDLAVQVTSSSDGEHKESNELPKKGGNRMVAITLGSRTFNIDSEGSDAGDLAVAISSVLDKNTELEQQVTQVTSESTQHKDRADKAESELSTVKGELKGAQTKLDEANNRADEAEKNRMDDAAIASAIDTRMDAWSVVLPAIRLDDPEFKPDYKLDEMDIKRLWLLRKDESLKEDENFKDDGFVNGLWRSLKPEPVQHADRVDGLEALVNLSRNDMGAGSYSSRGTERKREDMRKKRAERIAKNGRSLMGDRN